MTRAFQARDLKRWRAARLLTPVAALAGMAVLLPISATASATWMLLSAAGVAVIHAYTSAVRCPSCGEPYFSRPERAFGVAVTRHVWLSRVCANCRQ